METEPNTWSDFSDGGKAIVEQIPTSEEINEFKRVGLWVSQSGIQVGKLTIWVRSYEIKIITEFTGLSVPPNSVCQFWCLSLKTNTLADRLIMGTSSMLDEIESKTMHKDEEGDW